MTANIKSLVLIGFIALFPSLTQANALLLGIDFAGGSIDASNIGIYINFKLPH